MTVRDALNAATRRLAAAGFADARLEAEVLLQAALGWSRSKLLAHLTDDLPEDVQYRFDAYLRRRLAHEPSAYIVGHREFYGLDLEVTPVVLIPRPETELVVEAALALARERHPRGKGVILADIGTGSGAIALALASHLPDACLYAVDISAEALAVARRNAERLVLSDRIHFLQGDLGEPLPEPVDILVANLPYVGTEEMPTLAPEIAQYEPPVALFAGPGGLDVIKRLLACASGWLRPRGAIVLEIGHGQGAAVVDLAARGLPGAFVTVRQDLGGLDRVVVIQT